MHQFNIEELGARGSLTWTMTQLRVGVFLAHKPSTLPAGIQSCINSD